MKIPKWIKWFRKNKVATYEKELEQLRLQQEHLIPKRRRSGAVYTVAGITYRLFWDIIFHEAYINRWKI